MVISAKYFLFRAKWIVDTAFRNCFWLWNVTLMRRTEKLFRSFWLSSKRLGKHLLYQKNKQLPFSKIRRLLGIFYSLSYSIWWEFFCGGIVTLLILPIAICLSQRLRHVCLSISTYTVKTANGLLLNQLLFIWLYLLLQWYLW